MRALNTTYNVGDAVITRLTETELRLAPQTLYPAWQEGVGPQSPAIIEHLEEGKIPMSVHSWLVRIGKEIIIVDTGVGNDKEREFNRAFHRLQTPFLRQLQDHGVRPEDVTQVLLTHLHTDHIGWNTQLVDGIWTPTFPNATYVFPEAERRFLLSPAGESRRIIFEDSVRPVIEHRQAATIGSNGGLYRGFTFFPTPGHSVGHMSIELESQGAIALFTGDFAHSPVQIERPDLGSVFCADPASAEASRAWVLQRAADTDATVFTAHFPRTSAGKIFKSGEGFRWQYR